VDEASHAVSHTRIVVSSKPPDLYFQRGREATGGGAPVAGRLDNPKLELHGSYGGVITTIVRRVNGTTGIASSEASQAQ